MEGDFLFIHYGYGDQLAPYLTVQKTGGETFEPVNPVGKTITLVFNTAQRFCTGWHDLATSQSFPCPDKAALPPQFDHCRHCQNKTGFNPAFYHAARVSPQQQARNAQPHLLYLAHFGPGVVKVGISWAERGLRRLLDQGARSCLVIKTYPTAAIARQQEAKTASLPGIAETLQVRTKHKLLAHTYDTAAAAAELLAARQRLIDTCGITPDANQPEYLDPYYLPQSKLKSPIIMQSEHTISGTCIGMVGSTLVTTQNGQQYGLCVGGFTGYPVTITNTEIANTHQPQQASLF